MKLQMFNWFGLTKWAISYSSSLYFAYKYMVIFPVWKHQGVVSWECCHGDIYRNSVFLEACDTFVGLPLLMVFSNILPKSEWTSNASYTLKSFFSLYFSVFWYKVESNLGILWKVNLVKGQFVSVVVCYSSEEPLGAGLIFCS